jgi:hypothetical protein
LALTIKTYQAGISMHKSSLVVVLLLCAQTSFARGTISFNTRSLPEVMRHFREINKLISAPNTTTGGTQCGYIFPNDPNKFGCKGVGPAAAGDVAAACAEGGQLACTGSGANRTCVCAFD